MLKGFSYLGVILYNALQSSKCSTFDILLA